MSVPPKHLNSFDFDRNLATNYGGSAFNFTLLDETAIDVEYYLALGMCDIAFSYGYEGTSEWSSTYAGGKMFAGTITEYSLDFEPSGAVLTVTGLVTGISNPTDGDPISLQKSYKVKTPYRVSDVVKMVANDAGWDYDDKSIIQSQLITSSGESEEEISFDASGYTPAEFIYNVLAPLAVSEDGQAGYDFYLESVTTNTTPVTYEQVGEQDITSAAIEDTVEAVTETHQPLQNLLFDRMNRKPTTIIDTPLTPKNPEIVVPQVQPLFSTTTIKNSVADVNFVGVYTSETIENDAGETGGVVVSSVVHFKPLQAETSGESIIEYELVYGNGIQGTSVINFSPQISGKLVMALGGSGLIGGTVDADTNEMISTVADGTTYPAMYTMGNVSLDSSTVFRRVGSSSLTDTQIQAYMANLWWKTNALSYTATMECQGDPALTPGKMLSIIVTNKYGVPHHSSGIYWIQSVNDSIDGGNFTSSVTMMRRGNMIGAKDINGNDISISFPETPDSYNNTAYTFTNTGDITIADPGYSSRTALFSSYPKRSHVVYFSCKSHPYVYQGNPGWTQGQSPWGDDIMGKGTATTMAKAGCLVTANAIMLKMTGLTDASFSPGVLNQHYRNNGGYESGTSSAVGYHFINGYVPGWKYVGRENLTGDNAKDYDIIANLLAQGFYVAVRVTNPSSGNQHSVVALCAGKAVAKPTAPLGTSGTSAGNTSKLTTNETRVFNCLTQQLGYSVAAACAIMGNIASESSFSATTYGDYKNGKATSYGLCQWHNGRMTNLLNFLDDNGYSRDSIEGQLAFLDHELKTSSYKNTYAALQAATDLASAQRAADIFVRKFEVPANVDYQSQIRQKNTANYYKKVTS